MVQPAAAREERAGVVEGARSDDRAAERAERGDGVATGQVGARRVGRHPGRQGAREVEIGQQPGERRVGCRHTDQRCIDLGRVARA